MLTFMEILSLERAYNCTMYMCTNGTLLGESRDDPKILSEMHPLTGEKG